MQLSFDFRISDFGIVSNFDIQISNFLRKEAEKLSEQAKEGESYTFSFFSPPIETSQRSA
jgi:hypothetical protein